MLRLIFLSSSFKGRIIWATPLGFFGVIFKHNDQWPHIRRSSHPANVHFFQNQFCCQFHFHHSECFKNAQTRKSGKGTWNMKPALWGDPIVFHVWPESPPPPRVAHFRQEDYGIGSLMWWSSGICVWPVLHVWSHWVTHLLPQLFIISLKPVPISGIGSENEKCGQSGFAADISFYCDVIVLGPRLNVPLFLCLVCSPFFLFVW